MFEIIVILVIVFSIYNHRKILKPKDVVGISHIEVLLILILVATTMTPMFTMTTMIITTLTVTAIQVVTLILMGIVIVDATLVMINLSVHTW